MVLAVVDAGEERLSPLVEQVETVMAVLKESRFNKLAAQVPCNTSQVERVEVLVTERSLVSVDRADHGNDGVVAGEPGPDGVGQSAGEQFDRFGDRSRSFSIEVERCDDSLA